MKFVLLTLILLLTVLSSCSTQSHYSPRVVCYFDSQAPFKQGNGKFTVDDINSTLCTHLVYNHAVLNFLSFNVEMLYPWRDITNKGYEKFVNLRDRNPNLKVMITLQNWSSPQPGVTYSEAQINSLIQNVLNFLSLHKFDGINLDISYFPTDWFINFVEALGRIRQNQNRYLLSIVITNSPVDYFNQSDVSRLKQYVDFINLETYEFHVPNNKRNQQADHHAPLFNRTWDSNNQNKNVDSIVRKWIKKGFPPDKIVVGIPLFGISWTLSSTRIVPPAPASGPNYLLIGKAKGKTEYIPYYEICEAVLHPEKWNVTREPDLKMGPYAVSRRIYSDYGMWIGYDDPEMAVNKAKYILSNKLGGAAIANIEYDDFRNRCRAGRNPMISAIYNTLKVPLLYPEGEATPSTTHGNLSITSKTPSITTFKNPTNHVVNNFNSSVKSTTTHLVTSSNSLINKTEQYNNSASVTLHWQPISELNSNNLTVNAICIPTALVFAILSVILCLLLVTLIYVLAKIFCFRKATR